ncbi:amidohydrolase family protein [Candidatus Nomurabacteria bacterium]|nr:amidohydrolase family protein [Candidatus Nomurabacteria bacterium]
MTSKAKIIRLPGLIDIHVHLRDPGQTQKEDFTSGTSAALAGGFTTVVDMPNNSEPITTVERLLQKRDLAQQKSVAGIGFHYGSLGDNLETFEEAAPLSIGLKLYLNNTTGGYLLDVAYLKKIYAAWPKDKVVLLHVEEDVIDIAIESMKNLKRPVHVCHMPSKEILEKIINAKQSGLPITCGVCPHHLFLTNEDVDKLGNYGRMLPSLKTREDQQYLWEHLDDIDIFESDHAPHTHQEKAEGAHGVPGLETTLPLLLTAEKEGKITREQIIEKCHTNPARIFSIPTSDRTYTEVSLEEYTITNENLFTKCGWSPFDGQKVTGKVVKTVINGKTCFENGKIIATPGDGLVIPS